MTLGKSWGLRRAPSSLSRPGCGASRGAEIDIVGGSLLTVGLPGTGNPNIKTPSPHFCMVYWAKNVSRNYLPMSAMKAMGLVSHNFPSLHQTPRSRPSQLAASESRGVRPPPAEPRTVPDTREVGLPPCSNSGVLLPDDKPCSCPKRTLPPSSPATLPCAPTEENLPRIKQFILDRYAASSFNVCEHQPLPLLKGSPPLQLHVDPAAKPVAVHRPAVVPLHWQKAVHEGLLRDVRLGVLERVPVNTPVRWQSRMHITAKHNGDPRHTLDYQAVNSVSPRQTHPITRPHCGTWSPPSPKV